MNSFPGIIIGVIAVAVLIWMFRGSRSAADSSASADGELLDPTGSYQMGLLAGLMGGGIVDAVVYQFALRRFEEYPRTQSHHPRRRHGGRADEREVTTGPLGRNGWKSYATTPRQTITLTGLQPLAPCYIRLAARNAHGQSLWSLAVRVVG